MPHFLFCLSLKRLSIWLGIIKQSFLITMIKNYTEIFSSGDEIHGSLHSSYWICPYILFKDTKYSYTMLTKDYRWKPYFLTVQFYYLGKGLDFQVFFKKLLSLKNVLKLICMYFVCIYVTFCLYSTLCFPYLPPSE